MKKQGQGIGENHTDPGRTNQLDMVATVFIQDVEKNLTPYPVRVNLWTTIKELKVKICSITGHPVQR